jgi:hypothetical protein
MAKASKAAHGSRLETGRTGETETAADAAAVQEEGVVIGIPQPAATMAIGSGWQCGPGFIKEKQATVPNSLDSKVINLQRA